MTGTRWIGLPLFAFALWACDQPQTVATPTPEETFEAVRAALESQEWTALYDLTPPSERASFESHWSQEAAKPAANREALAGILDDDAGRTMSYREVFPLLLAWFEEHEPERLRLLEGATCDDLRVEGIRCRLISNEGEAENKLILLREEGRWFLSGLLSCVHRHALAAARDDSQR